MRAIILLAIVGTAVSAAVVVGTSVIVGAGCGGGSGGGLPPEVDGVLFNHSYKCSQTGPGGGAAWCADPAGAEQIRFVSTGGDAYDVLDVPDDGFVCSGTFDGLDFNWTATSPNGYTESGTWTFAADGTSFAGSSTYSAGDLSYTGACEGTGAADPAAAAEPDPVGACP